MPSKSASSYLSFFIFVFFEIQPLLDIEEKIIMKMGKKKIEQLNELLEEWNSNFKKYKDEE